MIQPELLDADATALLEHMKAGRSGPMQIMEHYLAVARRNEPLHAFVELFAEEALAAAQAAQQRWQNGEQHGVLAGVPIAVKNNIDVQGKLSQTGSLAPPWGKAASSAPVVQQLQKAGAIVLGSTHCVELALGGWGTNERMGAPRNPWSPRRFRVSGGSSSGSAVAVAAGAAPCALGTDTGGSIRTPAAWCGLTGLKVSSATLSSEGVIPLSNTLDTVGFLCLSARDAALLLEAVRTPVPSSRMSDSASVSGGSMYPSSLRLARLSDADMEGVQVEIRQAYESALDLFIRLGADVVAARLPCSLAAAIEGSNVILAYEAYARWRGLVEDDSYPMDGAVRARILAGRKVSKGQYMRALEQRRHLAQQVMGFYRHSDALLMPTVTMLAPALDEIDESASPAYFSRYANFLDLPALALPCGRSSGEGLPLSFQVVGPPGGENQILDIGRLFQAHSNWHSESSPARRGCSGD